MSNIETKPNWLVAASKVAFFAALAVAFIAIGFFNRLTSRNIVERRRKFTQTVNQFSKVVLWLFNVTVQVRNKSTSAQNHLIILNHLGFLDDFVMAATRPTMFVTSVELRKTPVVGLLSELAGCVYVEARDRSNIANEMKDIESALNQGFDVTLYPEAKTTDGQMVHPFKKTLLMSCANTSANLLPAVINFKEVNGETLSDRVRDLVFWYEKKPIISVIWNLCAIRSCLVELEFLNEIQVLPESDRREVAAVAQSQVESKYVKIPRGNNRIGSQPTRPSEASI